MRILQYRSFTAFLLLLLARTVSVAQISSVNYYRTLDAIFDITAGPDGAMWFTVVFQTVATPSLSDV